MDPLTLGLLIFFGVGAAVAVALLTGSMIRDYLRDRRTEASARTAVIKRKLDDGQYEVNAGFFEGGEIRDGRTWRAEEVDGEIANLQSGKLLVDKF